MKRVLLTTMILLLALVPAPGLAQGRGFTCTVSGAAKFAPGLTSTESEMDFVFKGELTDCRSTVEASEGKVRAKGTATGSCTSGEAEGVAKIKWADGKRTTVEFATTDVAAVVLLEGTVTKSNSESVKTDDDAFAVLAFNADPQQCETEEGIEEAEFSGQTFGGSPG